MATCCIVRRCHLLSKLVAPGGCSSLRLHVLHIIFEIKKLLVMHAVGFDQQLARTARCVNSW